MPEPQDPVPLAASPLGLVALLLKLCHCTKKLCELCRPNGRHFMWQKLTSIHRSGFHQWISLVHYSKKKFMSVMYMDMLSGINKMNIKFYPQSVPCLSSSWTWTCCFENNKWLPLLPSSTQEHDLILSQLYLDSVTKIKKCIRQKIIGVSK